MVASNHIAGNILDLLINQEDDSFISEVVVSSVSFTDLVKSKLCTVKESQPIVTIRRRNFKKLNLSDFKTRLCQSSSFTEPAGLVDDFVDQIEADVTKILDDLIPERTCEKRSSKKRCWLSEAAMEAKRTRRRLERRWLQKPRLLRNKTLHIVKSCKSGETS